MYLLVTSIWLKASLLIQLPTCTLSRFSDCCGKTTVLFQETRLYHHILCHLHWLIHLISPKSSSASVPLQSASACVFCSLTFSLHFFFLTSYLSCFYSGILSLFFSNNRQGQVTGAVFFASKYSPAPVTHLISTLNLPIYHFSIRWTLKVVHLTSSLEPSDHSNECPIAFHFFSS